MFRTYTRQELVDRWRLVRYKEPLRADVAVTFDGLDMSALDEAAVDDWWLWLVDTAPEHWLTCRNYADVAQLKRNDVAECIEVTMPMLFPLRRITSVRLQGWQADAEILSPGSREAFMQLNSYSRAGIIHPAAIHVDPWRLLLYPAVSTTLECLKAVDDSDYTIDSRCLITMTYERFRRSREGME